MAPAPIRVVVVDDHAMLRSGLAMFIETCPDIQLVGEASNGIDALEVCDRFRPDVVLMDLKLPELDGVSAIQYLRERYDDMHVIALSSFVDETLVQNALSAGATGYLLKNASIDALADAIRAAWSGRSTLAPEAAQALVQAAQRPPTPGQRLSNRELEVLTLMARGLSNTEIAEKLTIGVSTAKKHVSNILSKLKTSNRAEAVAIALRYRLVDD